MNACSYFAQQAATGSFARLPRGALTSNRPTEHRDCAVQSLQPVEARSSIFVDQNSSSPRVGVGRYMRSLGRYLDCAPSCVRVRACSQVAGRTSVHAGISNCSHYRSVLITRAVICRAAITRGFNLESWRRRFEILIASIVRGDRVIN